MGRATHPLPRTTGRHILGAARPQVVRCANSARRELRTCVPLLDSLPRNNGCPSVILLPGSTPLKQALKPLFVLAATCVLPASAQAASCHIPGGRAIAKNRIAKLISVPTP